MKTNKKVISETETIVKIDADGNETKEIKEVTRSYDRLEEPEYIKLYTDMWCKFNGVPEAYIRLFLALIVRMSYCDAKDLQHSQLVNTGSPWSEAIMAECGWTSNVSLKKGLKALSDCQAIKRVGRGVYQINPNFAGKGLWKYNPKTKQGGISDLVATFDFVNKKVETKISWEADEAYLEAVKEENESNGIGYNIAVRSAERDIEQGLYVKETKIS